MNVILRPTTENDLEFVFGIESEASKAGVVTSQSFEDHEKYLTDEDVRHLIIEAEGKAVGYLILAGLSDTENETIEFRRMVVAEKGKGYGRQALQLAKKMAFEQLNAHRLWLDVIDFNERARRLYESENFWVEGVWRERYKAQDGIGRESLIFMAILRNEYLEK